MSTPALAVFAASGRGEIWAIVDSGVEDTVFPPNVVPGQLEPSH